MIWDVEVSICFVLLYQFYDGRELADIPESFDVLLTTSALCR